MYIYICVYVYVYVYVNVNVYVYVYVFVYAEICRPCYPHVYTVALLVIKQATQEER